VAIEASRRQPAADPAATMAPDDPGVSRRRTRPAYVLALLLVLAVFGVTAIHLTNPQPRTGSPAASPIEFLPIPPVSPRNRERAVPTKAPEPTAEVMPDSLHADGMSCTSDEDRPVLDTVHPVLTAWLTMPAPVEFQLEKRRGALFEFVAFDRGDLTTNEQGYVTLYLRKDFRLERSGSYRWRGRTAEASGWSRWCEFSIAAVTPDSLNLQNVLRTAGLPPSKWRKISVLLDDPPLYWSIYEAGRQVSKGDVPIEMQTRKWETVIEVMAERASAINDPKLWRLVDTLSVKLGGPPHPTMGFPRA
jgi:hypothetical protein